MDKEMIKHQQSRIVRELCDSVKNQVVYEIESLDKIPPEWDGFEIRHYLAYLFNQEDLFICNHPVAVEAFKPRKNECDKIILSF